MGKRISPLGAPSDISTPSAVPPDPDYAAVVDDSWLN